MPINILILGYGNIDRQDDGVAWHILSKLSDRFGVAIEEVDSLGNPLSDSNLYPGRIEQRADGDSGSPSARQFLHLFFTLQLTPEMAELLTNFQLVCFIDAHTGNVEEDLQIVDLQPQFQSSPFTHHLTPQSLLIMEKSLYGTVPEACLVSVRGYEFGFDQTLSPRTEKLVQKAAGYLEDRITSFLDNK